MDGYEYDLVGSTTNDYGHQQDYEYMKHPYRHTLPCGCPTPWLPDNGMPCVLNQPMGMVVGLEGVHLSCPAHPAGHHIYGTQITC